MTQLRFPNGPGNAADSLLQPVSLMEGAAGGIEATFNFVLDVGSVSGLPKAMQFFEDP
ncbi:MAG: hypothetical protein AB1791_20875 [Chloroflexota bacterium]